MKKPAAASRPPMSAVCIRFRAAALSGNDAKQLPATVVERVEKSGKFWISTTELKGKTWFRINPVNFRIRTQHMEQLLALLEKECRAALGMILQPDRS
jgi:glutamate/tyrosine decarboxylase-like PLP-dependent enzyme